MNFKFKIKAYLFCFLFFSFVIEAQEKEEAKFHFLPDTTSVEVELLPVLTSANQIINTYPKTIAISESTVFFTTHKIQGTLFFFKNDSLTLKKSKSNSLKKQKSKRLSKKIVSNTTTLLKFSSVPFSNSLPFTIHKFSFSASTSLVNSLVFSKNKIVGCLSLFLVTEALNPAFNKKKVLSFITNNQVSVVLTDYYLKFRSKYIQKNQAAL